MRSAADSVGWYVDVPKTLVDEFTRLYPSRGAKTKFTIAAIKLAVQEGQKRERQDGTVVRGEQSYVERDSSVSAGGQEDGTVNREHSEQLRSAD